MNICDSSWQIVHIGLVNNALCFAVLFLILVLYCSNVWYRLFRGKGLSLVHLLTRSFFFCVLWVATNYMLVYALGKLDATAVMALQASSANFVYLLSWVILHEQFVGIRVSESISYVFVQ